MHLLSITKEFKLLGSKQIEKEPYKVLYQLFNKAVLVADPMEVIPLMLPRKPSGRVVVIGAGKASARMAEAVESVWGPCEGVVITRYGYTRPLNSIRIVEAAHPTPDYQGVLGTQEILTLLETLTENDFVLCLISGGASSLLCAPAEGLSLSDKQEVNKVLLRSGAPIGEMNVVRKHLSKVKGGQLGAASYPSNMLCLIISDVAGDNLSDIASGVTTAESSKVQDAKDIISKYNMDMPKVVETIFSLGSTVIPPTDNRLDSVNNIIVSAPSKSLVAAKELALSQGFSVEFLGDALEGEAKSEGVRQANIALKIQSKLQAGDSPVILLSGGEYTVSIRSNGIGGPNAEFALAALVQLDEQPGIYLISCDTDGIDGTAEVAGAFVAPNTLNIAGLKGINADEFLERNDSHSFFKKVGGQIVTGPTLTNVNDFRAFLIQPL